MAFDCIFIDFGVSKQNKEIILQKFHNVKTLPFVQNYKKTLSNVWHDVNTEFFWVVTDLINYENFDFDYIPEQFQQTQMHVWSSTSQKEGDTFLIPTKHFGKQIASLAFLRDYNSINYHDSDYLIYCHWPAKQFNFANLITQVKNQQERYCYYYYNNSVYQQVPSFWEDSKLYIIDSNKFNMTVPKFNFDNELYDHPRIYEQNRTITPAPEFDIIFIHNYEPTYKQNLEQLKKQCAKIPNKLHVIEGVNGRNLAYKCAANKSTTEYFYAVFAKCKIEENFKFNFIPDTLKTPRHYIFDCYNPVIDHTYGHQAVILYNKLMVLANTGDSLDFTLSQTHDHIPVLANTTTFADNDKVCFRTTFREFIKLSYFQKTKPTEENKFVLQKWLTCNHPVVKDTVDKAKKYFENNQDDYNKLFDTYEWESIEKIN